jgi:hypothetical protein
MLVLPGHCEDACDPFDGLSVFQQTKRDSL